MGEQVWSDWLRLRRSKRADVTATALAGIAREAGTAGWSLEAALAECCSRGWTGFKADWVADRPAPGRGSTAAEERRAYLASLDGSRQEPRNDPRTIDVDAHETPAPRLALGSR